MTDRLGEVNPFAAPEADLRSIADTNLPLGVIPAPIGLRIAATMFDLLLINVSLMSVLILVSGLVHRFELIFGAICFASFLFAPIIYSIICETSVSGATFGKKMAGIRVSDLQGNQPSFGTALLRVLLKCLVVGILFQPATRRRQALHDLVTRTRVIKSARTKFGLSRDPVFGPPRN